MAGFASTLAVAAEVSYDAALRLGDEQLALSADTAVELKIEAKDLTVGSCLYVPQQDPVLEKSIAQLAIRKPVTQDKASRQVGEMTWPEHTPLSRVRPAVYRITQMSEKEPHVFRLSYALRLAGWKDRPTRTRLLSEFYPVLLSRCPNEGEDAMSLPLRKGRFTMKVDAPPSWQKLAPGSVDEAGLHRYEGSSFSLVFYREGKVRSFRTEGGRLLTLSTSSYFEDLEAHAHAAIQLFETITGWRPEQDFMLIETEDYEPIRVPGLIVLNRPQQAGMRYLQEEFLHWSIWQLAQTIADQWYGISIRAGTLDDVWLTQGFADFLVVQFLDTERILGNLFAGDEGEEAYLQLGYRQAQDLMASLLSISLPHNALVDSQLKSAEPDGQRPPYAFVRHAQALRYLQWFLGEPIFTNWIKALTQQFRSEAMRPARVLNSLEQNVPEQRRRAVGDLRAYWQSETWPNMAIGGVTADGEGSKVAIEQLSSLRLAFDVTVKSKSGVRYQHELAFDEDRSSFYVPIPPREIESIEINQGRAIFDSDRFNNRDGLPGLALFPGDARTLADDAYTLLWIPLASKLPGQKFSLQLGLQLMRYVGSGLSGLVRYEPESGVRGFNLNYRQSIPDYAASMTFSVSENDGKVVAGERLWDLSVQRSPLWNQWSTISGSTRFRMRQLLGQAEKNHMTSAFRLSRKAPPTDACGLDLESEIEMSSWVPDGAFSYQRSLGLLRAGCDTPHLIVKSRWFLGATTKTGQAPGGALFQAQNLDEAHIRYDRSGLPLALRIQSYNLDLATPARLPLPEGSFVLPRRSLFKVYSDWGHLQDPDLRVQASGLGFVVPFGGDVVGRSPVTILQFSLYGVVYRQLGDVVDRKPGFIFDFTGDL